MTATLLVRAAQGVFPATALTPEGLEDVDTVPTPGAGRQYVQAKEQASADAFLGPGDLADFLAHVAPVLRDDPDATGCLVTNGGFGGGLMATGWDERLEPTPDVVANIASVVDGVGEAEVAALLRRVRLVSDAADLTVAAMDLADLHGIDPAVAHLALDRCLVVVTDVSAEQASRPAERPVTLTLSELDVFVDAATRTVATAAVPIDQLRRVVAPLTFRLESALSVEDFLSGVDVRPEHIAAGLDVARRDELEAIADGLTGDRLALILGPSGAGKSALLWRAAAEHAQRMRVWRVHALAEADADLLVAAIDQQRPSKSFPLLVCVDDIGRASRAGWRRAAEALLEMPGVYIVGAAREEDFGVADALRRAVLVRPTLTRQAAKDIERRLRQRGVRPVMAIDEAWGQARGLLMEFLHLVVAGRRLSSVLAEQAAELENPARATELAVTRYVTAAHSVGLDVDPGTLLQRAGGADLAAALSRLNREHLIVESKAGTWTGLHELRSAQLRALLHERPPPRIADTLAAVVNDGPAAAVASRLPVIVREAGDRVAIADAVTRRVASAGAESAQWLEAARLADVAEHARACVRVARTLQLSMNLGQWLTLAVGSRFAGVDLSILPETFHQQAAALPAPDPALFKRAVAAVDEDEWLRRITAATPEDGARLLEALETGVAWTTGATARLAAAAPTGDVRVAPRWIASAHRACADDAARAALLRALPPPAARLEALRDEWPLLIDAELDHASGTVRTRFIHPIDGTQSPEARAAELAATVLDLLPEARVAEVTVARYDGADLPILGRTGPHKAIPRENMPPQVVTRWNRGFNDWVQRELSSTSLTARLRQQAAAVTLARDVVLTMVERLLRPGDADRKHLRRWEQRREQLQRDAAALGAMPATELVILAPLGTPPGKRGDDAAQALETAASAAQQFSAAAADPDAAASRQRMRLIGSQLRDAGEHFRAAAATGAARLAGEPDPLDPTFTAVLDDAAAVLIGFADGATIDPPPERLTEDALRDAAAAVRDRQLRDERELLRQVLADVPGASVDAARPVSSGTKPGMVAEPRRWLLPVAPAAHAAVVEALLRLVRAASSAHPLAFRVIAAPAEAGVLYSYTATVIGARDPFPVIDVDELHELAQQARLPVRPGRFVAETAEIIGALVRASRAAMAAALLSGTRQEPELRQQASDELQRARGLLSTIDILEVADPLRRIADAVASGASPGTLALEIDDMHTHGTVGPCLAALEVAVQAAASA
ncbi:P-loop NTPase [Blastococcus sp. SYSU DS0828]